MGGLLLGGLLFGSGGGSGGGGGGGGGGPIKTVTRVTRTTFSADFDSGDGGDFEDITDMPVAPGKWSYVTMNFGANTANNGGSAHNAVITKAQFDALTVADAGDSPLAATGLHFRDFPTNAPGSVTATGRDIIIGKDADNKLIFATSATTRDFLPLTLAFVLEESVLVGGDGSGVGIIVAAGFPSLANTDKNRIYATSEEDDEGLTSPPNIKREGDAEHFNMRSDYLGADREGFAAYAYAARSSLGQPSHHGGSLIPEPVGLIGIVVEIESRTTAKYFVEAATTGDGALFDHVAGIKINYRSLGALVWTTLTLGTVTTPRVDVRRWESDVVVVDIDNLPLGSQLYAGQAVSAIYDIQILDATDDSVIEMHAGAHLVEVADQPILDDELSQLESRLRAAIAQEGTVEGWIPPQGTYRTEHVNKFLVDNGNIKKVIREHHDGHAKTVGGTASPGTWSHVGNVDEGGGLDAHFRGFAHRTSDITTPVTDDFFCEIGTWDFQVFSSLSGSRWTNYNPFETGAYWASIFVLGVATIPAGGWLDVSTRALAFDDVTVLNSVYIIRNTHDIIMATAIVLPVAADTSIFPQLWKPPTANPTAEWWGEGQTEKFSDPIGKLFLGGRYYRLTYKQDTPDNFWNDGDMIGVEASTGANAPNYDLITRDSAAEVIGNNKVLTFLPGRYRVHTRVWSAAADLEKLGMFVYEVQSGDDDLFLFAAPGLVDATNNPLGIAAAGAVRVAEFNEIFEFSVETQITQIFSGEDDAGNALANLELMLSFFTHIERLG